MHFWRYRACMLNCLTLMSDSMFSAILTSLSSAACSFSVVYSSFLLLVPQYSLSLSVRKCVWVREGACLFLADKWILRSYHDLELFVESLFTILTFYSPPPTHTHTPPPFPFTQHISLLLHLRLILQPISSAKKY